jgi:hypothetical protein
MDTLGIANLATSLSQAGTQQAVGTAVLKKALDAQSTSAAALIAALPPVPSAPRLPANLGNNINTTA